MEHKITRGHDARTSSISRAMATMIVTVLVKDQYGKPAYHPMDENARLFADLAGTKTLTIEALQKIKRLGYDIVAMHDKAPMV